jgi:hypothetical protein
MSTSGVRCASVHIRHIHQGATLEWWQLVADDNGRRWWNFQESQSGGDLPGLLAQLAHLRRHLPRMRQADFWDMPEAPGTPFPAAVTWAFDTNLINGIVGPIFELWFDDEQGILYAGQMGDLDALLHDLIVACDVPVDRTREFVI